MSGNLFGNFDEVQEEISKESIISSAQSYIGSMLKDLPQKLKESTGEVALEIICEGVSNMPVPVLNNILATTIRNAFGKEQGRDYSDALEMLRNIQSSVGSFENELSYYRINLDEISGALRQIVTEQHQKPCLKMIRPSMVSDYPQGDNEISFILANTGSGSIIVEEVFLEVEKWEPETIIDYSLPAAPLNLVMLEAELTVYESSYPLLRLNNEGERTFGSRGEGADKFVITLSSLENARYSLRLRIPYFDIASGESGSLCYPAPDEEPLIVSFCVAPGWKYLNPGNLLGRDVIFRDMKDKFRAILDIFEKYPVTDPLREQKNSEILDELRIWYDPGNSIPRTFHFLNIFTPAFVSMAVLEKDPSVAELILGLLCHEAEYFDEQIRTEYKNAIASENTGYYVPEYLNDMAILLNDHEAEKLLKDLILSTEFEQRVKISDQILSKMNPRD